MVTLHAGTIAWRLGVVALVVLMNALVGAAGNTIAGARRNERDARTQWRDGDARTARRDIRSLGRYVSATQLGIALASLVVGWTGAPALAGPVQRLSELFGARVSGSFAETGAMVVIACTTLTVRHIVIARFGRKLLTVGVHQSANRMVAMEPPAPSVRDAADSAMIAGVVDFHNKKARDVMRPRTDVVALDVEATERELRALLRRERYSRYPVYEGTLDNVIGVFLGKDFWLAEPGVESFSVRRYLRTALYIPDSRLAERVLDDVRRTRAHMAIILDEYGGTAGILTLEDLVEQVFGAIADEHDGAQRDAIETDGVLELAGSLSLLDVRRDHQVPVPDGEWSTLGGYTFARLGRLPRMADRVPFPGGELEVVAMDGRRVAAVRVIRGSRSGWTEHHGEQAGDTRRA